MQSFLKVFVIVGVAVIVALGLFVLVQTEFSMSMGQGGISPGFLVLLKIRADENGGRIAPSFDELGVSGGMASANAPGLDGLPKAAGGRPGAALSKGLDLGKAPSVLLRDAEHLGFAALLAVLLEVGLALVLRSARAPSES